MAEPRTSQLWRAWPRQRRPYVTQKYLVAPNTSIDGLPEAMARVQHLMPALSALDLIVAAGGVVPLALLW